MTTPQEPPIITHARDELDRLSESDDTIDLYLNALKAFVVLKDGAAVTEEELKAFVKERLAPYKYPRFLEFVSELPKTATGKIQRFRLREREKQA